MAEEKDCLKEINDKYNIFNDDYNLQFKDIYTSIIFLHDVYIDLLDESNKEIQHWRGNPFHMDLETFELFKDGWVVAFHPNFIIDRKEEQVFTIQLSNTSKVFPNRKED